MTIILASGSPHRRQLLENAGLEFTVETPSIDERTVEHSTAGSGLKPDDLAQILAEAKALDVAEAHADAFVVGGDQVLSLDGEVLHKPADMEEARRRLLKLSGRTHQLATAVVLARGGEVLFRHVAVAHMTMRDLDPGFVGRYLAGVGERALTSVGAYQIEGAGIQLFDKIEGDFFAMVGMPLLPLLHALRSQGALDG